MGVARTAHPADSVLGEGSPKEAQMSTNRSGGRAQTLLTVIAAAALVVAAGTIGCGNSPTGPSSVMPVPPSVVDEVRDFSGLVDIPGPTTMDLSLGIRRQSVDATPLLPEFFATLFAQETGTVSGTYTIQTAPPRTGVVEGRFDGESFLTAGEARVVLIEDTGGCIARRQYSGPVTAAGVNWVAGATIQPCPSAPFAELRSIVITATGGTQTIDPAPGPDPDPDPAPGPDPDPDPAPGPDPDPDPDPAPGPDPDPDPGPVFTLTVMLAGTGGGTVASSPTGINCGVDCTEDYAEGTTVTLTPTSNAGSVFAGWTGDGDCNDGSVTMDADRSCTANFDTSTVPTNNLTVTRSGTGAGTITSNPTGISCGVACSADYAEGTVVTLTPTANAGSMFAGWSGDADCGDGQVTMNAARTCTATFDLNPLATFTLTVSKTGTGSGTVTTSPTGINCGADCTESYDEGTPVTLIPAPASGSTFAGWSGDADCTDGNVTMNAARSCTATFDLIPPNTLAVTLSGTGTVTSSPIGIDCGIDCNEMYAVGTVVTLTATPGPNSTFDGWTGDPDCTDGSVTMDAARGCTATFTQITQTLTVTRAGSGSGTVFSSPPGISCGGVCMALFNQGSVVGLTAVAGAGSVFSGWTGDCDAGGNVTMSGPRSCTATFTQQFTLTAEQVGSSVGNITSSPAGIDCGSDCTELYDDGTVVTLTAPAAAMGSTFAGWSNGCSGVAAVTNVTVDANKTCTATYTLDPVAQFTLTAEQVGMGSSVGNITSSPAGIDCGSDCTELYDDGTVVTLTAPAAAMGSTFAGWSNGCSGVAAVTNVTVDANKTCTATYTLDPVAQFTLTAEQVGMGSSVGNITSSPAGIDCGSDCTELYDDGTVVTLTAPAAAMGSTFAGWSNGCSGVAAVTNVTVDANKTCTATYTLDPVAQFTLTAEQVGMGSSVGNITSSPAGIDCGSDCTELYDDGTVVTLTAPAAAMGSTFDGWSNGCTGVTAGTNVTVDANKTCTATFDLTQFTLTVTVAGGTGDVVSDQGGITCSEAGGDCTEDYLAGTAVLLTATPSGMSTSASWTGDCDMAGNVVPNMDAPKTCTVTFSP